MGEALGAFGGGDLNASRTPQLGFGTGSAGNLYRASSDGEVRAALDAAWEGGIRFFDTAPHYGLGLAEVRLGEFLADKPRDQYLLSTKVGRLIVPNPNYSGGTDLANGFDVPADRIREFDPSEDGVRRSLDDSLRRMGVESVDVVFLHDPDVYDLDRGLREGLPALGKLRDEGLAASVGIGTNSVEAAVRAVREGDIDLVMIASRYTLLEQPALIELLPLCLDRGVRVVDAAVFNTGLLATNDPASSGRYDYGKVPDEVLSRASALAAACRDFGVDLPAAALRYPLRHPAIDTVLVAASKAAHVRTNIEHFHADIPDELWQELLDRDLIPA